MLQSKEHTILLKIVPWTTHVLIAINSPTILMTVLLVYKIYMKGKTKHDILLTKPLLVGWSKVKYFEPKLVLFIKKSRFMKIISKSQQN